VEKEQVMSRHQTDLRPWLQDALDFIIDQLELAKSPTGQFAAVDAAQGMIPCIKSRLNEDQVVAFNFVAAFGILIETDHWKRAWVEMAKEPPDVFAKSADRLIGDLTELRKVLDSRPPQSK
jgi:hypothetical protein